jgi:hypothetical protein
MSRTFHHGERRIRVRAIRNSPPDLRRLARALIDLAQAQAEAEAAVEHGHKGQPSSESLPASPNTIALPPVVLSEEESR